MKSNVYFIESVTNHFNTIFDLVNRVWQKSNFEKHIKPKEHVAIKIHFAEWGNLNYIRPQYVTPIIEKLIEKKAHPFLTDTNTLYAGTRTEACSHIATGIKNGFGYAGMGVPIVIADGLKGNSYTSVNVMGNYLPSVKIANEIHHADSLICLSHFKFHELAGFGGALKNLGMGCASKIGKLEIHSDLQFKINQRCSGCGRCMKFCDAKAISIGDTNKAAIDHHVCVGCGNCVLVCNNGAIKINWDSKGAKFQKKLIEYCAGVMEMKREKSLFINFLLNITPVCDCVNYTPHALMPDIGIVCSKDPVAVDKASIDLVNQHCSNSDDMIQSLYPDIDWNQQLDYAEQLGLGNTDYELITISSSKNHNRKLQLSKISKRLNRTDDGNPCTQFEART